MSKPLLVFGSGGHAREVMAVAEAMNSDSQQWDILGFLDDDVARHGTTVGGWQVHGGLETFARQGVDVVVGIGSTSARRQVALRLAQAGYSFASLIDPSAVVRNRVSLGPGTVVFPGAVLTTDITLGRHVVVNTAASVSHDCVIGDFANIAPGARVCGTVRIAEGTDIGAGAVVKQGLHIGPWSIIGAGAVAISDIADHVVAVGVPAVVTRALSEHR